MNWENLREEEFKDAIEKSGGLCVLPLGCIEKHGQHMPVGADGLMVESVVRQAAELEDVVIFPTGYWLGDLTGAHARKDPIPMGHAGYIALKPTTLLTVLEELCDEIARNGFRKILIVNSHGGNQPLLNYFLRCQTYETKNYATMTVNQWDDTDFATYLVERRPEFPMLTDEDIEVMKSYQEKGFGGGHADFRETALIMGAYPQLIATDRYDAESGLSTHRCDYLRKVGIDIVNRWTTNFPNSIEAFPSYGCSQTIGQAIHTHEARRLAKIFKLLKEDEECVRIARRLPPLEK